MKDIDHDMINRYLDGEMSADEVKAFEVQMQQDTDLQQEVELMKDVNETLKIKLHPGENELALRNTLGEMRSEYFSLGSQQAKIIPFRRRRWVTAAAAILIMAVMLTIWSPWNKEDLYKQYASIQMPGIAERGSTTDSLMRGAIENFNNKKFAEAIPSFEEALKDDPQNTFVQYYYGIALLQNRETGRSRINFIQLYNGVSLFRYDAAFYMALSYLNEKDRTNCKEWLNKIPADAAVYSKAQELLKKL